MTKQTEAYFTYAHIRKSDNEIFYIGKGKGTRHLSYANRNIYWKNTVAKHGLVVEKLDIWENESDAFKQEIFLIKFFKNLGYPLVNMTIGGDGLSNPSEEVRAKMSKNNAMKRPEISAKISIALSGRKLSKEQIEKMPQVQKGKKVSDLSKQKMSKSRIGVKKSESTKAKMSARWKNNIPEALHQKMSDSAKKAWDKRKGISNEQE